MATKKDPQEVARDLAKELERLEIKSKEASERVIRDFTDIGKKWSDVLKLVSHAPLATEEVARGFVNIANTLDKTLIRSLNAAGRTTFPELIKQSKIFLENLQAMTVEGSEFAMEPMLQEMRDMVDEAEKIHMYLTKVTSLKGLFKSSMEPLSDIADKFSRLPVVGGLISSRMTNAFKNIELDFEDYLQDFQGGTRTSGNVIRSTIGSAWREIGSNIKFIALGLLAQVFLSAVEAIWKRFMSIQDTLKKITESTGVINEQLIQAEKQIVSSNIRLQQYGVTLDIAGAAWQSIHNITGTTLVISQELVDTVGLMAGSLKMGADEAAQTFIQIRAMANASDDVATNIINSVTAASKLAGVAPKKILADMAKNAKFLNTYFRGSVEQMAKASVYAQRIGLNLDKVGKMTEQLLEWDTAIEDEMNASVMLGRQINFQKARQLMFEGDIKGATDEVINQIPKLDEWNKLNFLQKKAIAKAAGLEAEEITSSLKQQELLNNMGYTQLVQYNKSLLVLEELRAEHAAMGKDIAALTQAEKLSLAWDRLTIILTQLFVPILEVSVTVLTDVLRVVGDIIHSVTNLFTPLNETAEATQSIKAGFDGISTAIGITGVALLTFFGPVALTSLWGMVTGMAAFTASLFSAAAGAWAVSIPIMGLSIPIYAVIAAVAALAASVYLVIKYWEPIKKFFSDIFDSIGDLASEYGKYIIMAIFPVSILYYYWAEIKSFFSNAFDWVVNKASEYGKYIMMGMFPLSAIYFYWDKIKQVFSDAMSWIIDKISNLPIIGPIFKGLVSAAGTISSVVSNAVPFAQGGIVTKPTLGLVGESPEAIIPLHKAGDVLSSPHSNKDVVDKIEELISTMRTGFAVYIDGKKAGDAIMENYPHPLSMNT